ncbi:response regulator [Nocardioides dilutus]
MAERARPLRVVIIDDTYDLRELLRLALTRGGLEVVGEAGDGLAGIECVRLETPDVVLLDLSMPVMDGLEALPTIRRLVPQAKIVVLSGFGATQMSDKAMNIGADGYLQKGMALKRIIEYVKDIVDAPDPVAAPSRTEPDPEPPQAPVLSVVPDSDTADSDTAGSEVDGNEVDGNADDADDGTPDDAVPAVSAWEALALAPFGVIEVVDEPLFRLVHANPVAHRLLGHRARSGTPLAAIAPELASLVAFNRLDGEAAFDVTVDGSPMQASLRRADGSLLIYLDSSSEDVGALRRAIATAAHEIRGPVAVLCGIAESITTAGQEMSETQRERLMASVTRQARMLDTLTADLLTSAEIQRGTLRLEPQPVDPLSIIDLVVSDRHLVSVSAQVEDDRRVLADPMRLEQMLANLVGNALKYGRAPYVVRVEPDPIDHARLRIAVIDSGEGVPDDFQDQLFQEFSRPSGSVPNGTGLGLYVVRSLAEAQGGSVSYRPGPTGGAVFTLTLPVA